MAKAKHSFKPRKSIPWLVCSGCGLVRLRNAFTDWCVARGCDYDEHEGFAAARRRLTGKNRGSHE